VLVASPGRVRRLNLDYRGIDSTTDVLSFPMYDSPREFPPAADFLLGDIVINPVRAEAQARERGVSLDEELRRLLVHGLLHLLGYDHERNSYQRSKMRRKERELLELFG
jgi:probable rRNA maturation factor